MIDKNFHMLGGGQKEVNHDDLLPRTLTIRVNVECKTDEREVTATVPLYEVPLLKLRYNSEGGSARVTADWLPNKMRFSRLVVLTNDMLRDEIKRLEGDYRIHQANGGVRSLFKDVYGRDGDPIRGFYAVIAKHVKAWKKIEARIVGGGAKLSDEDLNDLVGMATPRTEFDVVDAADDLRDRTLDLPDIDDGSAKDILPEDPMADLQEFLGRKGYDVDIIIELCKAIGDGKDVTSGLLMQMPSMHGKKGEARKLLADHRAWVVSVEKKLEKAKADAAHKAGAEALTTA